MPRWQAAPPDSPKPPPAAPLGEQVLLPPRQAQADAAAPVYAPLPPPRSALKKKDSYEILFKHFRIIFSLKGR